MDLRLHSFQSAVSRGRYRASTVPNARVAKGFSSLCVGSLWGQAYVRQWVSVVLGGRSGSVPDWSFWRKINKICLLSVNGLRLRVCVSQGSNPSATATGGPAEQPGAVRRALRVPRFGLARVDGRWLLDVVRRPYCTRVGGHWGRGGCTPRRSGARPVRTTFGQWIPTLVE